MVFSIDTIKESKENLLFTENNAVEEYSSYFDQTLALLMQEDIEFNSLLSSEVLSEGILSDIIIKAASEKLKTIDYGAIFAKIFDWFIEAIERLVSSFGAFLLNFVNKDAQLKGFKSKLMKLRGPVRYTKSYYEYQNLDISTSYTTYQAEIEKEYNDLVNRLQLLGSCKNNTDIAAMMSEIKVDLNDDTYLDMARARVLGSNVPITEAEYANALFVYFRGSATPIDPMARMFEKNIDGNRVHQAAEQYFNSRAQEAKIRRDQAVLKAEALKEKVKLRTLNPNNYLSGNMKMESEARQLYNSIVGLKCRRVKAVCDIYRLLFSAKIDALRDYTLMNKEILLEACKEIVREG